jgi:hypothetical protein
LGVVFIIEIEGKFQDLHYLSDRIDDFHLHELTLRYSGIDELHKSVNSHLLLIVVANDAFLVEYLRINELVII